MRLSMLIALSMLCLSVQAQDTGGVPVTTVAVERGDIRSMTHVLGLVEPLNAPTISSKVAAELLEVRVDEGDRVRKGQVLARLDDEGFRLDKAAAEADIARLQATLENQLLTLKRDARLFKKGLVPDTRIEASRTAVKQTRASLVHARTLLKKAEYRLSHTIITAPIDGVVQTREASAGDYLDPMSPLGKPLFQIVDDRHLRVRLYLSDRLAGRVKTGLPVRLRRDGEILETRISRLRPMIDQASRSLVALADFDNRYHWPPGIRVAADVVLAAHHDALLIPSATLVQRPGGATVYRVREGRAEAVRPRLGIREGDRVEVLSGLAVGDRLVLDGAPYLDDGVKLRIVSRGGSR